MPRFSFTALDALQRNLRYAVRVLVRAPAFTLVAVASLALGIAVNTTMFSIVNSVLLRPLGPGGDRLVRIGRTAPGERTFKSATYAELTYLRANASSFEDIAGTYIEGLTGADDAETISAELVAGEYLALVGASPRLGRAFLADENRENSLAAATVISDRYWRERFAADHAVIGRVMPINRHPFTIVGVAPSGFTGSFPGVDVDVWIPAGAAALVRSDPRERLEVSLGVLGRLREGVSHERAEAELDALGRRLSAANTDREGVRTFIVGRARGAHPLIAGGLRPFLMLLMAVVGVVLLIACANVAALLLARANARSREVAVRLAVGGSRRQLIAQLLVESGVLATLGGVAGAALSLWPMSLLDKLAFVTGPTGGPLFLGLRLDVRVLTFTAAATVATAFLFGLIPAIQATCISLASRLKGEHAESSRVRSRLQGALVATQVCASFVLLVAALLLVRALHNTARVDVGFDPDQVIVAEVDLRKLGYDASQSARFRTELLEKARALPGAQNAASASFVPLGDRRGHPAPFILPEMVLRAGERPPTVPVGRVSEQYFATLRQRLIKGRDFSAADRGPSARVAIVNEAMARRYWPGVDPLGRSIGLGEDGGPCTRISECAYRIVGVVGDARFASFSGEVEPMVYVPAFDAPRLHVRTTLPPADALRAVQRLVAEIDANAARHFSGRSLREIMASSGSLVPVRIARVVVGVAGVIALLLATGGLYGLVSYTMERRMKEIGIRVAMGASRPRVFGVVVGGAVRLTIIGLVIGAVLAASVMFLLSRFLYGLSPTDPVSFGGIAALLALVTLAAGYAAARRALALDPVVVLRYE